MEREEVLSLFPPRFSRRADDVGLDRGSGTLGRSGTVVTSTFGAVMTL